MKKVILVFTFLISLFSLFIFSLSKVNAAENVSYSIWFNDSTGKLLYSHSVECETGFLSASLDLNFMKDLSLKDSDGNYIYEWDFYEGDPTLVNPSEDEEYCSSDIYNSVMIKSNVVAYPKKTASHILYVYSGSPENNNLVVEEILYSNISGFNIYETSYFYDQFVEKGVNSWYVTSEFIAYEYDVYNVFELKDKVISFDNLDSTYGQYQIWPLINSGFEYDINDIAKEFLQDWNGFLKTNAVWDDLSSGSTSSFCLSCPYVAVEDSNLTKFFTGKYRDKWLWLLEVVKNNRVTYTHGLSEHAIAQIDCLINKNFDNVEWYGGRHALSAIAGYLNVSKVNFGFNNWDYSSLDESDFDDIADFLPTYVGPKNYIHLYNFSGDKIDIVDAYHKINLDLLSDLDYTAVKVTDALSNEFIAIYDRNTNNLNLLNDEIHIYNFELLKEYKIYFGDKELLATEDFSDFKLSDYDLYYKGKLVNEVEYYADSNYTVKLDFTNTSILSTNVFIKPVSFNSSKQNFIFNFENPNVPTSIQSSYSGSLIGQYGYVPSFASFYSPGLEVALNQSQRVVGYVYNDVEIIDFEQFYKDFEYSLESNVSIDVLTDYKIVRYWVDDVVVGETEIDYPVYEMGIPTNTIRFYCGFDFEYATGFSYDIEGYYLDSDFTTSVDASEDWTENYYYRLLHDDTIDGVLDIYIKGSFDGTSILYKGYINDSDDIYVSNFITNDSNLFIDYLTVSDFKMGEDNTLTIPLISVNYKYVLDKMIQNKLCDEFVCIDFIEYCDTDNNSTIVNNGDIVNLVPNGYFKVYLSSSISKIEKLSFYYNEELYLTKEFNINSKSYILEKSELFDINDCQKFVFNVMGIDVIDFNNFMNFTYNDFYNYLVSNSNIFGSKLIDDELLIYLLVDHEDYYFGPTKIYKNVSSILTFEQINKIIEKKLIICDCNYSYTIDDKYTGNGSNLGEYLIKIDILENEVLVDNFAIKVIVVTGINSDYMFGNQLYFNNDNILTSEKIVSDLKFLNVLPNISLSSSIYGINEESTKFLNNEIFDPGVYDYSMVYSSTSGESGSVSFTLNVDEAPDFTTVDPEPTTNNDVILEVIAWVVVGALVIGVLFLIFRKKPNYRRR